MSAWKAIPITVTLKSKHGLYRHSVGGYRYVEAPGLALTPFVEWVEGVPNVRRGKWKITQITYGHTVTGGIAMSKRDALAMLRKLAPLTDWTDPDVLRVDIEGKAPWSRAAEAIHAEYAPKYGYVLAAPAADSLSAMRESGRAR